MALTEKLNFVGYEPTRKEQVIFVILYTVLILLFAIYIMRTNPNPKFVCDFTCQVINAIFIVSSVIIAMIITSVIIRT
jgi:hypothetical protein